MADAPAEPAGRLVGLALAESVGGIGAHVASVAGELTRAGLGVRVVAPAATGERFGLAGHGADFRPVEAGGRALARAAAPARLRAALAGCDLVHAHGLRAGLAATLALGPRPRGVPLVVTLHNALLAAGARRIAGDLLAARVARRADVVLGASSDLVAWARELGASDARLAPVAAPPLPAPRREAAAIRAELGAGDRPLLVAVGRLAPQKDYDMLLDAAMIWRGREPTPLVAVAGDGPLRERLAARIAAADLPVTLLGHRRDVADLLAAADVAVLTSRWEARALVAQEALRAGVPLAATAVGGVPELVGEAAALVPAGDAPAFAAVVEALLDDDRARARLAAAGRAVAASWPSESDTARQLLSVYRELWSL